MKKLYLKNGDYICVKTDSDNDGKYIRVHDFEHEKDGQTTSGELLYSVFSGKSAFRQTVIFATSGNALPQYDVLIMAEIIQNFNQYFNNLNQ